MNGAAIIMSVITATTTTIPTDPADTLARSSPITIRPIQTSADRRAWAAYVTRHPYGTLFHHPDWSTSVRDAFGHHPLHLLAVQGTRVSGVLPLFEIHGVLSGKLLVSVPYATQGGVLGDDDRVRQALADEAMRLTERRGACCLELRSHRGGIAGMSADERYANFARQLPRRVEDLATFLPRKARAATRQAQQRENLCVRHDNALLPLVWQLYARSMRRLASINYPIRFFNNLTERLQRRVWVSVVWRKQRPIAGLLSFVFGDTVTPYFIGVDERVCATGATNLLYFAVMERAVRAGLRNFDFGRSRKDNAGSYRFKKNQGFEPRTLGYQRYVPEGRTPPDLTPDNPRFSLARRIWPHLPLALTKPLGAWLSGSIPG